MAERGLGRNRHKFHLTEVQYQKADNNWHTLYDGASQKLTAVPEPLLANHKQPKTKLNNLTIEFITPTRLKFNGEYGMEFNFRMLVFKMIRRILELAHFYVPEEAINWEFGDLLDTANDVNINHSHLHWVDLKRYSSRQRTEMKLGGLVGTVSLQGELNPFLPLLQTSEILHVGKATTFGLGKVRIC